MQFCSTFARNRLVETLAVTCCDHYDKIPQGCVASCCFSDKEEWVLLNLELEGFNIEDPFDFEKGDVCELHTQRTPLDYALELSGLFSDGATDETHAARHSTVCKKLSCSSKNQELSTK